MDGLMLQCAEPDNTTNRTLPAMLVCAKEPRIASAAVCENYQANLHYAGDYFMITPER